MIQIIATGDYQLFETQEKAKTLVLGTDIFLWTFTNGIGELVSSEIKVNGSDTPLCSGQFKLSDVKDEAHLTSVMHLELITSSGRSQDYLLLSGLPDKKGGHRRIVPTIEKVRVGA